MQIFRLVLKVLAVALLVGSIVFVYLALPIVNGFASKTACSCVFNSGRSTGDVIRQEFSSAPYSFARITVNMKDSTATASVWGLVKRKAIFRKGLGCTLVSETSEKKLRSQQFSLPVAPVFEPDTLNWPLGNKNAFGSENSFDQSKLAQAYDYAFAQKNKKSLYGTRSLLVLHDGKIVKERYADGFSKSTPQTGWSMTKSITNALVGILVKQGKLSITDHDLFADWSKDERRKINLGNLLNANSGLHWNEIYFAPGPATNMLFKKGDMAHYAASFSLDVQPGTQFKYSSGTTNMLSYLVRQKTDSDYYRFPYEQLFHKIGMLSAVLEPDASGTFVGSSFCFATARDWARFGLLYLNDGMINGERILPEGWVTYTRTPAKGAKKGEYGAQFWLNAGAPGNPPDRRYPDVPTDCFWPEGFQGQQVWIIPSKKLVIVRLSLQNTSAFDENKFLSDVIAALTP